MKTQKSVTVFAPATVANVAVGFDILGFAIDAVGDTVTVSWNDQAEVIIEPLDGIENAGSISTIASKNTAGLPLIKMLADHRPGFGLKVKITKGIPLGSGMGGSAASSVGAVVAANILLGTNLSREQLLTYALEGEAVASGSKHSDNIAPCLYGGLTLTRPGDEPDVISIPYPSELYCVLVHPSMVLNTKDARAVLKKEITLKSHSEQAARLAAFITGCCTSDFKLIQKGLEDILIEPARAPLIPGFYEVKKAAMGAGVLGCSISGAGPSVFAFTQNLEIANRAKEAMILAFQRSGSLAAQGWISPIRKKGATQP